MQSTSSAHFILVLGIMLSATVLLLEIGFSKWQLRRRTHQQQLRAARGGPPRCWRHRGQTLHTWATTKRVTAPSRGGRQSNDELMPITRFAWQRKAEPNDNDAVGRHGCDLVARHAPPPPYMN